MLKSNKLMKPIAAALTISKNTSSFPLHPLLLLLALMTFAQLAYSQNYVSKADGMWNAASTWTNKSGSGANAPATGGSSWGSISIQHDVTSSGNLDIQSVNPLSVNAGQTLLVNGNFSISNGTKVNVSGTLHITGNATISADLNINPGGQVIIDGNATVINSDYLNVGNGAAPGTPAKYGDLIIRKNLNMQSSGDVTVTRNGRVAVWGNVTSDNGGGAKFQIGNGGQVYVDGNMDLKGGGDLIGNYNTTNPFGLYVNGSTNVNTGQGATKTSNNANKATLIATNDPFWQWVTGTNAPLPVKLALFRISSTDNSGITLTWTTTTEINFDKFIIEHSTNGVDFETLGEQKSPANNTNSATTYTFKHTTPTVGRNYYRLKSVDLDTKYEYSGIVQGEYTGSKAITLFPNPSTDKYINLSINFAPSEGDIISIYDMYGTLLQQNNVADLENQIDFTNTLKPGTYVMKYASNTGNNHILRFVVR